MSLTVTITCIIEGKDKTPIVFKDKTVIKLGRLSDNDVVFDGPSHSMVSGRHAEIKITPTTAEIVDNKSSNGLIVSERRVQSAILVSGEIVQLGHNGPKIRIDLQGFPPSADTVVVKKQSSEAKYGDRTVGMLVRQALAQAGLIKSGTSKSTDYFEKMVEEKTRKLSFKLKLFVSTAILIMAASAIGLGIYLYKNRSVQYIQQTQIAYGEAVGAQIATANRHTVFLLAGISPGASNYQGFCTAFSIASDTLATNAHCVQLAVSHFQNPIAVMNGAPSSQYQIVKGIAHANYKSGQISPDVGLLKISGRVPYAVAIAPTEELMKISAGMPVFLYGFPGRLANPGAPEATFITGQIGRITALDQSSRSLEENVLIQHSAFTSSGTSGSPLFDSYGRVIGINTGGYTENGQALSGYNFGMRIDLINSLRTSF